ncbi:hypothetical protein DRO53_00500 [Candidatus Bathyarchaeota archaeon]|nr:MAG: hypothetical protein DRO53_00500 [Candidatus Bathyarchaeota archaeon]
MNPNGFKLAAIVDLYFASNPLKPPIERVVGFGVGPARAKPSPQEMLRNLEKVMFKVGFRQDVPDEGFLVWNVLLKFRPRLFKPLRSVAFSSQPGDKLFNFLNASFTNKFHVANAESKFHHEFSPQIFLHIHCI